jgi:hypothetical protein
MHAEWLYVSVTGLSIKSAWHAPPRFWWHALRSMAQARAAEGNLFADARIVEGIHHTLTVWRSEAAMRAYLRSGPHLVAMRALASIGTGRVLGYTCAEKPGWDEVLARLELDGRAV